MSASAVSRPSLIDTHCHLDRLEEVEAELQFAQESGLQGLMTIGTRWSKRHEQLALLAQDRPELRVWCALGTHPDHAYEEELPTLDEMVRVLELPGVVAVGETGLDYLHGSEEMRPRQKESFRRHIAASRETGLPLVIHSREADEDMGALLTEEQEKGAFPFLLHCFAGGEKLACTALELGGYLSFSGLLTFPKCGHIRDVARKAPESRILVETDSPFLAPVPKRGKANTPGFVVHTAERLAQEREMDPGRLAEITTANALRLFSRAR
ncbi:TatD family hydrolase [Oecophyllibacter saccharovorans]|uniref:TatD family hydrolase n=1 Tax=Oecophyllibacter saccharovorans TaxID=2558360 RepID=UPI001167C64C|nr:TatD family hydrolase [Oecophyllibacter saccharovorans]TPW34784.1 TatD family deoxyribonuclease [Oecophyllibacter saccharovorans]